MKPLLLLGLVLLVACHTETRTSENPDVLVSIGKSVLSRADLNEAMPGGLSADDSVKFARAFIRSWIDSRIVSDIAAAEIDLTEIDKMVDQYRRELIMWEYSRQMYDSHKQIDVPEDSLRSYYDSHPDEFVLKRPMVKGAYIKVADTSKDLPALRKVYRSSKSEDLDKIEKSGLDGAVHYDYFLDTWIDWEQIESRIPYDIGPSADKFLRSQRNIDYSQGGFTYLLNVTDVKYTGDRMPYSAARDYIIDRLTFHDKRAYDIMLREKLFRNALDEGKIRLNCQIEDSPPTLGS